MVRGKQFAGKQKRGFSKNNDVKKKKQGKHEVVNKKAIFNRYKSSQKREDAQQKKSRLDRELQLQQQQQQMNYSESEEEENPYEQLVFSFAGKQDKKLAVVSESESEAEMSSQERLSDEVDSEADVESVKATHNNVDFQDDSGSEQNELVSDSDDEITVNRDTEEQVDSADDPFTKHLQYDLEDELVVSLADISPTVEQVNKTWPVLGNISFTIPKPIPTLTKKVKPKVTLLEEKTNAPTGTIPSLITTVNYDQLHIKTQIHNNIVPANKKNLVKKDLEFTEILTPLQKELFSVMNNYQDFYYPERTFSNADEIRFTYCLHVVNHMLKTRTKILHHNAKLAKKSDLTEDFQDQGLVRPKVLIMVPFKDAAYRVVKTIIDILVPKEAGQVVNKNRFEDDFTGGELLMPRKNPKPEDYELLFSGNTDDTFRLGMTLTKKTLKLYTEFYSSDVIVASPLGLRMILGAEGEEERDYDFLASVELLVLDQADVFLMQNWEHALHVLEHLHLQPRRARGTDYSRVRSWAVNGWAKYYRQTLVFSSVALPEIKAILNRKCQNYAGKALVANPVELGSIRQVVLQIPQIFHRFEASSPLQAAEARFAHFVKELLPRARDALQGHTLLYVPSYFDYVRIRNHFKKEDIGFVQICEYSKDAKIARARDMFFHSEAHFLLYSERAHFFRRLRIKGARHVLFYQPPTYPHFYAEMCNLMQESNQNKYGGSEFNMSVSVLYSQYDAPRLAGVLGARRAAAALRAERASLTLVTGD